MKELKPQMIIHVIILLFSFIAALTFIINNKINMFLRLICVVIFGMTFWLMFQRDTYLPFLGYAALPPTLIKDTLIPESSNLETRIPIDYPDGTKVIYWGAMPSNNVKEDPYEAYKGYANSGISYVDSGEALIRFNCPARYNIPWGTTLNRHIHYRVVLPTGLLSPIKTVYVNC